MDSLPAHDTLLTELDANVFRKLVICLQREESWRTIAEFLSRIFDQSKILSLSTTVCPPESFLNELGTKLCTIENLAIILRECALYDAFLIISEPEKLKIIRQPTDSLEENNEKLKIGIGSVLQLEFEVSGVPPPKFQWFKDDEILEDQVASVLRYKCFAVHMEGEYYCRVTQEINHSLPPATVNSDAIKVEALPLACTIEEKPDKCIELREGSTILLKVKVFGHPQPKYEWLHENTILKDETKDFLHIKQATKNDSGKYRCFISNKISSLEIITHIIVHEQDSTAIHQELLSDKVALLIGNDTYENLPNLTTPSNDICAVAETLQTFGFKVMCLQNLNLKEMEIAVELFASTVQKKSFAFFYYAGHGFEMVDRFLQPTDSPQWANHKKTDALAETKILQKVLDKDPALFVFLLDMCLKLPDRLENPTIYKEAVTPYIFTPNINLIRGYSTTSYLGAYEKEGSINGMYMQSLQKYLSKDLPILTILNKVNAEISVMCPQQMPSIYFNTTKDFYLSNPVIQHSEENDNHIYSTINVSDEKPLSDGGTITLSLHKNRIHNVIDIIISNVQVDAYCYDTTKITIKEIQEASRIILRVINVQRLQSTDFCIRLKINNTDFFISKQFQITNLFKRLKIKK